MTNQQHPIIPPPKLVEKWWDEAKQNAKYDEPIGPLVATQAAQWGADQELEACVEWLGDAPVVYNDNNDLHPGSYLRDDRRPKPSLKEQALTALRQVGNCEEIDNATFETIRQALEALPND